MFPLNRYKYYIDEKNGVVVAIQTFAQKKYRGIARCSGEDVFDVEKGKKLAALKCNQKIASARLDYANHKYKVLTEILNAAIDTRKEADDYLKWAAKNVAEANEELIKFVDEEL